MWPYLAVGGDELQCRYGRREVAVPAAGAVRRGADGSRDCDVGKRREIREREASAVEPRAQLAIRDARVHGDRLRLIVELERDRLVQRQHGQLGVHVVGDRVEGVAGAQHRERRRPSILGRRPHYGLHPVDGVHRTQVFRAEDHISRPIRPVLGTLRVAAGTRSMRDRCDDVQHDHREKGSEEIRGHDGAHTVQ